MIMLEYFQNLYVYVQYFECFQHGFRESFELPGLIDAELEKENERKLYLSDNQ